MTHTIKSRALAALLVTIGLTTISVRTYAHHGTGIAYDTTNPTTLTGTVTEFKWQNPHAQLFIDTKDKSGSVQQWAVEMNSPGVMTRQGWTRRQFKAGDEVTITVYPSKAGALVGSCIGLCKVTINGKDSTPKPTPGPGGGEQF